MKVMFCKSGIGTRLLMVDDAHDLDHAIRLAETVAKDLALAGYSWYGIFESFDNATIIHERTFGLELKFR